MKTSHHLTVAVLAVLSASIAMTSVSAADNEKMAMESRMAMKALGMQLKGQLGAAMKAGGPVNAITTCNTVALPISQEVSKSKDMDVARTALKLRNPGNAPDAWEKSVLDQFEARKAKGEDVKKMEYFEVVEANGKKQFRYMKPIPTGEVCLHCHGGTLKPPVAAKLDELYPQDKARGFNMGDIRGAFTITRDM